MHYLCNVSFHKSLYTDKTQSTLAMIVYRGYNNTTTPSIPTPYTGTDIICSVLPVK